MTLQASLETETAKTVSHVHALDKSIGAIDASGTARLITAASDVALVLDSKGVICDLAFNNAELSHGNREHWLGRPWVDTVTTESRAKVEMLLRDADAEDTFKVRELNHRLFSGEDLPVRYSAVQLGRTGPIIALGRDMRMVSRLQQRLMDAQRSMERDYLRLRSVETRYRILFQLSGEAILIVDAAGLKIIDGNPAAISLLDATAGRLVGRSVNEIFDSRGRDSLIQLLEAVRSVGKVDAARATLANGKDCFVSASMFRQDEASHILVRLSLITGIGADPEISRRKSQVLQTVEALPDAFLVIDNERNIIDANTSFLEIAELSNRSQAVGQPVERWLGRSGTELNVLFANIKDHGSVRDFTTVIRGEYGSSDEVDVSGVYVAKGDQSCYGLVAHHHRRRTELPSGDKGTHSRSASQLSELVGRVPLKELVRETSELTERLCIEASLNLTGDNRAAAAQMLGLSRQSLYSKLRRYNLGNLGPNDDEVS